MSSSEAFRLRKLAFTAILGPDVFPATQLPLAPPPAPRKSRRKISKRTAAVQTDLTLNGLTSRRICNCACTCDAAAVEAQSPTPSRDTPPILEQQLAPSDCPLGGSFATADLAPIISTLFRAGVSSAGELVDLLLFEDGIFDTFFSELGNLHELDGRDRTGATATSRREKREQAAAAVVG